jgi:hypothetical protein
MTTQKYAVNQYPIQTLLTFIESNEIAIPEIQRPFVWEPVKVRNLLDSLLQGYPIGYLIAWRNPNVKLKDGTSSTGKRILIDGQQRVTALRAALLGREVLNKEFETIRIKIAYNPCEQKFEVSNPAIEKNVAWLPDVSAVFLPDFKMFDAVNDYCRKNPDVEQSKVFSNLDALKGITHNQVGLIELDSDLSIEIVTEIFIRVNSAGMELSQADFAMSKIASNEIYGGNILRKAIDYFCHMSVSPEFYKRIKENDKVFSQTEFFSKMSWLKDENDDIYDPSYTDMLRVAFTSEFKRGKLQDLVALLSGRNFETRQFEEIIAEQSFAHLEQGILNFINETNFKNFLMIIRSAGFIDSSLISSQNALNFAYILYLTLKELKYPKSFIGRAVPRWFVLSMLTGRYSGSLESVLDYDIRQIHEGGYEQYVKNVIDAELSPAFWDAILPQAMNTSSINSPYFRVFVAAQIKSSDKGFLSRDITVQDLVAIKSDIHHIFPKNYLKKADITKTQYNQIANYAITQSEINIAIGDRPPAEYFSDVIEQANGGNLKYGGINNIDELDVNLALHCIPNGVEKMKAESYNFFLEERRKLMSAKIKKYFESL